MDFTNDPGFRDLIGIDDTEADCPTCGHPNYLHNEGGCCGYHRDPAAADDEICGCVQ